MAARNPRRSDTPAADAMVERTAQDGVAMERLAQTVLPALIARFEASGLGELEVRRGDWRVRLRKPVDASGSGGGSAAIGRDAAGSGRSASATGLTDTRPGTARSAGTAKVAQGAQASDGVTRTSPMAAVGPGRQALAPSPGSGTRRLARSPAVGYFAPLEATSAGRPVRAGDVLGHVDVLGVRQEVVAPSDGVVGRILAEPGQAVEYGQELVRLEVAVADAPAVSEG